MQKGRVAGRHSGAGQAKPSKVKTVDQKEADDELRESIEAIVRGWRLRSSCYLQHTA